MDVKVILIILSASVLRVCGQCTFQSPFADTRWRDNNRGTLVFGSTTMTGWGVTINNQLINSWQCVDNSSSQYIVLRSTGTFSYSHLNLYVYLCMKMTKISDYSYYYYQQHDQQLNAGSERLLIAQESDLTLNGACETVTVPTLEFHVLVKEGNESAAALTCANTLLYTADYSYSDGTTTDCTNSTDYWDVCTEETQMTFNYTTCARQIAYSAGGQLYCVANMEYNGYQCTVVYNTDTSIVSTTRQFSCICSDGVTASVAPNNCTADQTPSSLPTEADGTTPTGHLLTYGTQFVYCGPQSSSSGGLSGGAIAGIVIAVLIIIVVIAVGIYCYMRHRKNKVSESETPMLANGAVAHAETVDETSKREKTSISAITRDKTDLDKSLIQRNATMSSIGLSLKKEKSSVTQVQSKDKDEKAPTLLGFNVSFLPCLKPKGDAKESKQRSLFPCLKKKEDTEEVKEGDESKGTFLSFLPCLKKKEEAEVKPEEPMSDTKPKPKDTKAKTEPKKGKGGKKGAKGKGKAAGKGKKSQEAQTDKKEDMNITDVDESDAVESSLVSPKKEKTDLLGKPQMASTPKPEPSQKSPQISKKNGKPATAKNGIVSNKTPAVVNGLAKPTSTESKDWTFLACCFGKRSPPPQDTEDAEGPIVEKKQPPKGKKGAKAAKGGAKKPAPKKGGKKGGAKAKKEDDNTAEKEEVESVEKKAEDNKLERAKTMPERQREKTVLSITDAEKVKVDVYVPNEKTQLQLKDTVTVVKGKKGEAPVMEKSKSALGLERPVSSTSKPSSRNIKSGKKKADKPTKKGGKKSEKGNKGGKEKKAAKKKKK